MAAHLSSLDYFVQKHFNSDSQEKRREKKEKKKEEPRSPELLYSCDA